MTQPNKGESMVEGKLTKADVFGRCFDLPTHMEAMPTDELYELLDFANEVQAWAFEHQDRATFGAAAEHFKVPVEKIAEAVCAHYWMFTLDDDRPLPQRRIEHEGE